MVFSLKYKECTEIRKYSANIVRRACALYDSNGIRGEDAGVMVWEALQNAVGAPNSGYDER